MKHNYLFMNTRVGELAIVSNTDAICAVVFKKSWRTYRAQFDQLEAAETPLLKRAKKQLEEYFTGQRRNFNLPLSLAGTEFQQRVWRALAEIPYGQTISYSEQGQMVGAPRAVRAIGRTNGLNPIAIVLPCHRVIGKNGSLTGYAGGLDIKRTLLELESLSIL